MGTMTTHGVLLLLSCQHKGFVRKILPFISLTRDLFLASRLVKLFAAMFWVVGKQCKLSEFSGDLMESL